MLSNTQSGDFQFPSIERGRPMSFTTKVSLTMRSCLPGRGVLLPLAALALFAFTAGRNVVEAGACGDADHPWDANCGYNDTAWIHAYPGWPHWTVYHTPEQCPGDTGYKDGFRDYYRNGSPTCDQAVATNRHSQWRPDSDNIGQTPVVEYTLGQPGPLVLMQLAIYNLESTDVPLQGNV